MHTHTHTDIHIHIHIHTQTYIFDPRKYPVKYIRVGTINSSILNMRKLRHTEVK